MGAPYTREELERADALSRHMRWEDVAAELGKPFRSLKQTTLYFRKGKWQPKGRYAEIERMNAICEEMVASGVYELRPIAERLGVGIPAACKRLCKLGLDREMRKLEAAAARKGEVVDTKP